MDVPEYTEEIVVANLQQHPLLKWVELDRLASHTAIPNDELYAKQWYLPKINVPTAWDIAQGVGVTIAIVDSGVDPDHEDFAGTLVPGWNIWDDTSDTTDLTGHGSLVSGLALASTNNSVGIAGVSPQSKLMPIRVTEPTASGAWSSNIVKGIIYAADHGARIANVSFQNMSSQLVIQNAAQYMKDKNGLVVVSAGNTGQQESYTVTSTMIPVAATDENDNKASFSSYGEYVTLAAPGSNLVTTNKDGSYSTVSGTSGSSPIVAGVIAQMMSVNPQLSNIDIEQLLFATATDLGVTGKDSYFGYGRIDAAAAVLAAQTAVPNVDTQTPTVTITKPLGSSTLAGIISVDVLAQDNVGVVRAELWVNGTNAAIDTSVPFAFAWDSNSVANGLVNLSVYVYDAAGNQATQTIPVYIDNPLPPPIVDVTPPIIRITNPIAGNVSGSVVITTDASDDNATVGITQMIYIDSMLVATGKGSTLTYNWNTYTKKNRVGPSRTITAVAKDEAGNTSSASVIVKISNQP